MTNTRTERITNFADLQKGDVANFQFDDGNGIVAVVSSRRPYHTDVSVSLGKDSPASFWAPESAFVSATREIPVPEPKLKPGTRVEYRYASSWHGTVLTRPSGHFPGMDGMPYVIWDGDDEPVFNKEDLLVEIPGFSVGDKVVVRAGAKMSNSGWSTTTDRTGIVIPWRDPDWTRRNGENHVYVQLSGQLYGTIFKYEDVSLAKDEKVLAGKTLALVGDVSELRIGDIVVAGPVGNRAVTVERKA
jgi:hypothetical protein